MGFPRILNSSRLKRLDRPLTCGIELRSSDRYVRRDIVDKGHRSTTSFDERSSVLRRVRLDKGDISEILFEPRSSSSNCTRADSADTSVTLLSRMTRTLKSVRDDKGERSRPIIPLTVSSWRFTRVDKGVKFSSQFPPLSRSVLRPVKACRNDGFHDLLP